jgi:hypothetical protein
MNAIPGVTGEQFEHKVAGIFGQADMARQAEQQLRQAAGIDERHIHWLDADTAHPGRRLEPDSQGIWRTLVRSHVWLGLIGAGLGLVAFAVLWLIGVGFVVGNPAWSAGLLVAFSALGGLLLGGVLTLRPDHTPYLLRTREAIEQGAPVLAVEAESRQQMHSIEAVLREHGARTVTTL